MVVNTVVKAVLPMSVPALTPKPSAPLPTPPNRNLLLLCAPGYQPAADCCTGPISQRCVSVQMDSAFPELPENKNHQAEMHTCTSHYSQKCLVRSDVFLLSCNRPIHSISDIFLTSLNTQFFIHKLEITPPTEATCGCQSLI